MPAALPQHKESEVSYPLQFVRLSKITSALQDPVDGPAATLVIVRTGLPDSNTCCVQNICALALQHAELALLLKSADDIYEQ